jgi:NADPH:quinone reductase-like Zn-dependent oxidoreductase
VQAAYVASFDADDPVAGLVVGARPDPVAPDGWTVIQAKAASLNHHDLWSLRGVGLKAEQLPMTIGGDLAGIDTATGAEVIVHSVIATPGWTGDETLDPGRTLFSELHQGTLSEYVVVPSANVLPKPAELSFAEAACLPTAWLTAYRMLFVRSGLKPGQTVLVQGASGGVASAGISLARAAGLRVWATARTEAKQEAGLRFGAHATFATGARLPERVDAVIETVGAATWSHSLRALKPGGVMVLSGATSGFHPDATELNRIFFLSLSIIGSTMGTRSELQSLISMLIATGLRPHVDRILPLAEVGEGLRAMADGDLLGKIVIEF